MHYPASGETRPTTYTVVNGENGEIRIPIGYRFLPTDEELVVHYLFRKALNVPMPASVIPVFNVFQADPWNLPGDLTEKRFFFTDELVTERSTNSGEWKLDGTTEPVVSSGCNQLVGTKTSYFFHEKKLDSWMQTQWIMHEFRLVISENLHPTVQRTLERWTAYRIYEKKIKIEVECVEDDSGEYTMTEEEDESSFNSDNDEQTSSSENN